MRPGIREFGRISQSIRGISYGTRYAEHKWRRMLSLCGYAGALGTARDARGDRSAELVQGHILAGPGGVRKCGGIGACDQGRRSRPITMIVTSDRLGDAGPCRHGVTNVRRTAEALVAIGDGADAEHAHGSCTPWVEGDLRNDVGGRTRWCTIAIFIAAIVVTGTSGSAGSPCARRCEASVRRWRARAGPDARRRREAGSTVAAATADGACAKRGDAGHRARTPVAGTDAGGRLHRTAHMTPVVKTQKAAGAVRHRPLCLSQAPISSA